MAAFLKLSKFSSAIQKGWKAILVEFLLLTLGIFLALWLENLDYKQTNKEEALQYLSSMDANLKNDIKQFSELVKFKQLVVDQCYSLFNYIKKQEISNQDTFLIGLTFLLEENRFIGQTVGFDILKNSGKMNYLGDFPLQLQIYEYYNLCEVIKIEDNTHNKFIQEIVEPYFYEKLGFILRIHPFDTVRTLYQGDVRPKTGDFTPFLKDSNFEFLVYSTLHRAIKMQKLYQAALEKAELLHNDIQQ